MSTCHPALAELAGKMRFAGKIRLCILMKKTRVDIEEVEKIVVSMEDPIEAVKAMTILILDGRIKEDDGFRIMEDNWSKHSISYPSIFLKFFEKFPHIFRLKLEVMIERNLFSFDSLGPLQVVASKSRTLFDETLKVFVAYLIQTDFNPDLLKLMRFFLNPIRLLCNLHRPVFQSLLPALPSNVDEVFSKIERLPSKVSMFDVKIFFLLVFPDCLEPVIEHSAKLGSDFHVRLLESTPLCHLNAKMTYRVLFNTLALRPNCP